MRKKLQKMSELDLKRKKFLQIKVKGGIIYMKKKKRKLNEVKKMIRKQLNILSFEVGGFRNIVKTKVELNKMTAIIGLNGYGKSNVISAIQFGIDFIKLVNKERYMNKHTEIPLLNDYSKSDYSFEMEAEYGEQRLKYGFSFAWRTDNQEPYIKDEHLLVKDKESKKFSSYIKRGQKIAKYKASPKSRCDSETKIDKDLLLINIMENVIQLFYNDIVDEINNVKFYVEKHLDTASSFSPEIFKLDFSNGLDTIYNIPSAINEMKNKYPEKYNVLIDTFKQIFPTIEDVEPVEQTVGGERNIEIKNNSHIVYTEKYYALLVKDKRLVQYIRFENLSDGTRRVFLALTFAVLADIYGYSVIAFEEPETSIHPSLLQAYLRVLDQLSGECKIIFTSHSPYMIQYMPLDSIYIGLCSSCGMVDLRKIAKPKSLMIQASKNDRTVGDLVFNYLSFSNANDMLAEYLSKPLIKIEDDNCDDNDEDNDWLAQFLNADADDDETADNDRSGVYEKD